MIATRRAGADASLPLRSRRPGSPPRSPLFAAALAGALLSIGPSHGRSAPAARPSARRAIFEVAATPLRSVGVVRDRSGALRLEAGASEGELVATVRGLPAGDRTCRVLVPLASGWSLERAVPGRGWVAQRPGEEFSLPPPRDAVSLRVLARGDPPTRAVPGPRLVVDWRPRRVAREPSRSGYVRAARPEVVDREAWGAAPPREPYDHHRPVAVVIHHSAQPDHHAYLARGGAESVAGIQRFHRGEAGRGWNDIGYHFLVGPDGLAFEGRPTEVIGAHAVPNTGKVGICVIGNHEDGHDPVSPRAWTKLVDLVAFLGHRYDVSMREALHGHREFSSTKCPGDRLYERLSELREEVFLRIGTMGGE